MNLRILGRTFLLMFAVVNCTLTPLCACAAARARSAYPDSVDPRVVSTISKIYDAESRDRFLPTIQRSRRRLSTLRYMVDEPSGYAMDLAKVTIILGQYGDSTDCDRFDRLASRSFRERPLPGDTLRFEAAMTGMGALSSRWPQAMRYLEAATRPQFFRQPQFGATFHRNAELRRMASLYAVCGLGYSHNREAATFLEKIKGDPRNPSDREATIRSALARFHKHTLKRPFYPLPPPSGREKR